MTPSLHRYVNNFKLCIGEHDIDVVEECVDGDIALEVFNMYKAISVHVSVTNDDMVFWLAPFRRGALVPCRTGNSLAQVLTQQLGMDADYIERRVRTVFINGCPVDDLEEAVLADRDEVALAGAMPGLVGICMGRNSPVAGFRRDITFKSVAQDQRDGFIVLKLFNTVGLEAGPLILKRGIMLPCSELRALAGQAFAEGHRPLSVQVAGSASNLEKLSQLPHEGVVELQVVAE